MRIHWAFAALSLGAAGCGSAVQSSPDAALAEADSGPDAASAFPDASSLDSGLADAGSATFQSTVVIDLTVAHTMAAKLSGANQNPGANRVQFTDAEFQQAVSLLNLGWIRYPSGAVDDAFDWTTGQENAAWLAELQPGGSLALDPNPATAQQGALTACVNIQTTLHNKSPGQSLCPYAVGSPQSALCGVTLPNFANFLSGVGALNGIAPVGLMEVNGLTDSPASAGQYAAAAVTDSVPADVWELTNEASEFQNQKADNWTSPFWADASGYADKMQPFHDSIVQSVPTAHTALFYVGKFFGSSGAVSPGTSPWDTKLFNYNGSQPYWDRAAVHVYTNTPGLDENYKGYSAQYPYSNKQYYQNYILGYQANSYYDSYFSVFGTQHILIDITELNGSGHGDPFLSTWYNGIFLSEYIARLSTDALIENIGIMALYMSADASSLLIARDNSPAQGKPYGFSLAAPGVALSLLNKAVNSSTRWYRTAVTSSPSDTVPTVSNGTLPVQFSTPIPSVFAQAYLGDDGTHYVFITNKSPNPETVALSTGTTLPASVSVITAEAPVTTQSAPLPDPSVSNDPLPAAPMVQASAATPASPTAIAVPGYGVALVSW